MLAAPRSFLAAFTLLAALGCHTATPSARTAPAAPAAAGAAAPVVHPAWTRNAVIYEVNIRQYTAEGTFAAFRQHLPRLAQLGADVIWLMPVQPIGHRNRKGPLGSYYAVADYTAFNPEFGSRADFEAIVRDAHRLGMHVILDWVPNHTAFDHVWIAAHPDWYLHHADGSIMVARDDHDRETDWTDVAELDYGNADMRRAMIAAMRWWVDSTGIDGFRADVAGGVPMDFWTEARRALIADRPDLFMLAEAEGPKMHAAFDMTYGWEFHHLLNDVAQGKQGAAALDAYFARQDSLYAPDAYRMFFTSNHDENSWNGSEFERMGANAQAAFVLAATAERGMPLLYTGQEASLHKRLRFFEKDTVTWSDTTLVPFYRAIFDLKHREVALGNGAVGGEQVRLATDGGDRAYAFTRTRGSNTVLVALNFGDSPAALHYRGLAVPGRYTDWFSRQSAALGADGTLDVPAHGWRVLVR